MEAQPSVQPPKYLVRFLPAVLILIHAVKMWTWFRAIDWSLPEPILNVDYVQFYGRALRMHHFLGESGRIWGYDPFDMAGYVSGPFLEVGTHLLSVFAHVLSPIVPIGRTLLFTEVAGLALAPFLIPLAVRVAGGSRSQAWAAFAFSIPVYGFIDPFSAAMSRVGLWGFMMSSFLAPLQVALAWRWMSTGSPLMAVLVTLAASILFGLHPASLVVVIVPNLALFLLMVRPMGWKRTLVTLVLAGIAFVANLYWIRPFAAFASWKDDAPYFVTAGLADIVGFVTPIVRGLFHGIRLVGIGYLIGLALTALFALRRRDRQLTRVLGAWLAWLFIVGFFGSEIPGLKTIQPGRNIFPFWILCIIMAGMVTPTLVFARRARRRFAGVLFALLIAMMFRQAGRAAWYFPLLTNRLPAGQEAMISYLQESPVPGRVMLECVDAAVPHVADIVPFRTGRVLYGGQHPGNFLITRWGLFSGMYNGGNGLVTNRPLAFGHALNEMGEQTLARYLDAYDIALIGVRSNPMRAALEPFANLFEAPVRAGDFHFLRVKARSTWLHEGRGDVSFALDRIRIKDASTGRIVVKAHWIRTLKTDPPMKMTPVYLLDDPVPFIALDNAAGAKDILIYNAGL